MINKGVSVIICSYNGKLRLFETLRHLSLQDFNIPMEIILIDNASTDDTKTFADNWWFDNGKNHIKYNSFIQPIAGKSFAQEMAYSIAKFEYLLICDDDNWLSQNYIQNAFEIMEENIKIGALGGWCEAVFEGIKPLWFDENSKYFAVSRQGKKSGDITKEKGCLYGAGMVIRKSHWLELKKIGFTPLLTCRKGESLSSGGDTEYCYALRILGYKIWYDDRLYFEHFMSTGRLNLKYLNRLKKAISDSNFVNSVYLDFLKFDNFFQINFFHTFYKKFFNRIFIKNIIFIIIGNSQQRDLSIQYFINFFNFLFKYKNYIENKNHLKITFLKVGKL